MILVDSSSTLEASAARFGSAPRLVACSYAGILACELAGRRYETIDDFCDHDAVLKASLGDYDSLLEFCERADAFVAERAKAVAARRLRPFTFSYFYLKLLRDSFGIKALQLDFLLAKASQEKPIFYRPSVLIDQGTIGEPLPERVNLHGILIEHCFASERGSFEKLSAAEEGDEPVGPFKPAGARQKFRALKRRLRPMVDALLHSSADGYVTFMPGHDVPYVVSELRKMGLVPESLPKRGEGPPDSADVEACLRAWQELSAQSWFSGFFAMRSRSYYGLIENRLKRLVTEELPRAIGSYDVTKRHLSLNKGKLRRFALTGSALVRLPMRAAMQACRDAGFKLITYQEGGGYGATVCPFYDYTEMRYGDLFLCYGQGNVSYYRDRSIASKPLLAVGSAHQDTIAARFRDAGPPPQRIRTITYVGNHFNDNWMYCANHGFTPTWYFRTQQKIFRALNALSPSVKVKAKLHPADTFSRAFLSRPEFARFELIDGRLEDALDQVDLFIIDYPSTTMFTCAHTNAHLFLLVEPGVSELTEENREFIEKRMFYFEDYDSFASELPRFVADPASRPARDSRQFVEHYVTNPDGAAARRVAEYLAANHE